VPIYDYRCDDHGEFENIWAKVEEVVRCTTCEQPMTRLISPTRIMPDWQPYLEHNMGVEPVYIKSRQHYYNECYDRGLNNQSDTRGRVNNSIPDKGEA